MTQTPDTVLVCSPTPEGLCLAAWSRPCWSRLAVGGIHATGRFLRECNQKGLKEGHLLLFMPLVSEPSAIREELRQLTQKGKSVTWCCPLESPSVKQACHGLNAVRLVHGLNLEDAVRQAVEGANRLQPLLRDMREGREDLVDYLQYRISLFFMRIMAPAVLEETIGLLQEYGKSAFHLEKLSPADQASVESFRLSDFPFIEGQTERILDLKRRIMQVGPSELSTLVVGETGTGKELVAFYLHEFSSRRSKPLVALNCAGLQEETLRSELFGHKEGAFTGATGDKAGLVEEADEGTLFLDEIAEMPRNIQADLLRFLQTQRYRPVGGLSEKKADVRILAATQPVIYEMLETGDFRTDLYYRIAGVELETPPLREVPEDIRRVIRHLIHRHANLVPELEKRLEVLDYFDAHLEFLKSYPWPGNAREIFNMVRKRLLLGDDVMVEKMQTRLSHSKKSGLPGCPEEIVTLEEYQTRYIQHVYNQHKAWGMTQKALLEKLDISPNTMRKYREL